MKQFFIFMSLIPLLTLAADRPQKERKCVFPEETYQLTEALEKQQDLVKVDRQTLDTTAVENLEKALQFDVSYMNGRGYHESVNIESLRQEFLDQDGAILYFKFKSHDPHLSDRLLALATSYPGDNEYGYIYSVRFGGRGSSTFSVVAKITDGFISDCSLKK